MTPLQKLLVSLCHAEVARFEALLVALDHRERVRQLRAELAGRMQEQAVVFVHAAGLASAYLRRGGKLRLVWDKGRTRP